MRIERFGPRARAAAGLAGWLCLGLPLPCHAIAVSSPADLGPAEFWVYVEGTNGAFARMEAKDTQPVSLDIEDPVIGGVPFTGHLILGADVQPTGPATRVNAVLQSGATGSVYTDLDLASFVTFDLAVFSTTAATASVRVVGSGLGGRAGFVSDDSGFSASNASGYVTLYETDAAGLTGPIVDFWEVPGTFTTTPVDGLVILNTNELYRIIVRSLASVDMHSAMTVDQYAYLYMDPQVSLAMPDPDLELAVSANVPEAIPEPAAASLAGAAALALFALARRRLRTRRRWAAVLVLAPLWSAVAHAAPAVSLRTLALSGDPAPGAAPGVELKYLFGAMIDDAGEVAFRSTLQGPGVDSSNDDALWLASPNGAIAMVLREGQQVPGRDPGVLVFILNDVRLDDNGEIALRVHEYGAGFNARTLWGPDGQGGLVELAAETEAPPDGAAGELFSQFDSPELANDGVTAFVGYAAPTGSNAVYQFAPPGPLERIYAPGNLAVGLGFLPVEGYFVVLRSREGTLSLGVYLDLAAPGVTIDNRFVLLGPDGVGGLEQRWRSGDPAIGLGDPAIRYDLLTDYHVNDRGDLALGAHVKGPGITTANRGAWYGPDAGGDLTLVARQGDPAPGLPGAVIEEGTSILLNDLGEVGLEAELSLDGSAPEQGIFGPDASGNLVPRLVTTWDAPGFPAGVWVTLLVDAYLNDRGDMLFDSIVVDPQDGPLGALYWSSRAGDVVPIVHEGQALEVRPGDVRTVADAVIAQESDSPVQRPLNEAGDIVFTALFDDGTTGLFVASVAAPEPAAVALEAAALVTLAARARRSQS